ncbi:MAG: type II toxin-antitoxin system RelE/ParE family toxin [Bacteroidetes bacterium]|nr:MAG: type II toxin-antitoxin system RelE/ParE family toxin [Bacteroidota bacterium]
MAKRTVRWTRTADIQFVGVLEYWVKRNKSASYSKKLIKKVANRTKKISENPFIFKEANYKDIRVSILDNFSIFFKVTDEEILITAFWDNRQDPNKLLLILKNEK